MTVELQEEVKMVKNYVSLYKMTHIGMPFIEWKVDAGIPFHTSIPSMSIQIPVENALKYAFGNDNSRCDIISIVIKSENHGLSIHISDNGCGYNPGKLGNNELGTGNGLKVLSRTIELLNTQNSVPIQFNICNLKSRNLAETGTLVTLFIPYKYKFNL